MKTDDSILDLFKRANEHYLSGEEISQSLGITRQALWKHIEKLRETGYVIEAVPHLGYKIISVPDRVLAPEIKWKLKTKILGREIRCYETLGSTNDVAYGLAEKGAPEGSVVLADEQIKGKGRLGRKWVSPIRGGVYLSAVLRPEIMPSEIPQITLVSAVSALRAIRRFSGCKALVKWPNDVLISDMKVAGILTEMKAEMDRIDFIVIGIGVNVNVPKNVLPPGASSIKEESKSSKNFSRTELARIILEELEEEYNKFREQGFKRIRDELKSYSCTIGRRVGVTKSDKKKFYGKAVDIDKNGALLVELDNGSTERFISGDVTLVR